MIKEFEQLKKNYEAACNDLVKAFAETYEVQVDETCWVGDAVGGTIFVNEEYAFNMQELIFMLEHEVAWEEYLRYFDYCLDCSEFGFKPLNLMSYVKGAPRYDFTRLKKMKADLDKEVERMKEEF